MNGAFRFLSIALLASTTLSQAIAEEVTQKDFANVAEKVSLPILGHWLSSGNSTPIPASKLPLAMQSKLIEQKLIEYQKVRGIYYGAKASGELGEGIVAGGFAAAVLYLGPQSTITVPATLIGAGLVTYMDNGNQEIERIGVSKAKDFLAKHKSEIVIASGVSNYEELRQNPNKLKLTQKLIEDVKARAFAANDIELEDFARNLLVDIASNTSESELNERLPLIEGNVSTDLADATVALQIKSSEVLEAMAKHGGSLEAIRTDVDKLTELVGSMDSKLKLLGKNERFVAEFVFNQMDPKKKAEALREGYLGDRFVCPESAPGCNPDDIRDSVVAQFEYEAKVAEGLRTASGIVKGLGDVSKIASDLGLDISPDLAKAAEVGNAAFNAVASWFSGNPLGAVSSITGLFGKRKDPNTAMMSFLKRQFEQVNIKLDEVLRRQELLQESIVKLSEQMRLGFEKVDSRLNNIAFEQNRISEGVRSLIWKPWAECYSVYSFARSPTDSGTFKYIEAGSHQFNDLSNISVVFQNREPQFKDCLQTIQTHMDSLSAVKWFGNFIDAQWVVDEKTLDLGGANAEASEWHSRFRFQQEQVFAPAARLASDYFKRINVESSDQLAVLSSTSSTFEQFNAVIDFQRKSENAFMCFDEQSLHNLRFYRLLCDPANPNPNSVADSQLARPIAGQLVVELADWIKIVSQIADVYDPSGKRVYPTIADISKSELNVTLGRDIIEKSVIALDITIANYGLTYGAPAAFESVFKIGEALSAPSDDGGSVLRQSGKETIVALRNNSYLASNFVNAWLRHKFSQKWNKNQSSISVFDLAYADAYRQVEQGGSNQSDGMTALFGSIGNVLLDENGIPSLEVSIEEEKVVLQLPTRERLASGIISYPPTFYRLVAKRDEFVDREFGYRILKNVNSKEVPEFATVLLKN